MLVRKLGKHRFPDLIFWLWVKSIFTEGKSSNWRGLFRGLGRGGGGTKRGTYVAMPFAIRRRSFNLSFTCLSPFHLSYVAVSSPYRFSEFCFKQGLARHNIFSSSVSAIIIICIVSSKFWPLRIFFHINQNHNKWKVKISLAYFITLHIFFIPIKVFQTRDCLGGKWTFQMETVLVNQQKELIWRK